MAAIERFYAAAANAGILVDAVIDGRTVAVDFRAPDETVLDGLALSTDYRIRYPRSVLPKLANDQAVQIAGVSYTVCDIRTIGDGSECQAMLSKLS